MEVESGSWFSLSLKPNPSTLIWWQSLPSKQWSKQGKTLNVNSQQPNIKKGIVILLPKIYDKRKNIKEHTTAKEEASQMVESQIN